MSCQQLLTADDSCHEKSLNVIFIYTLKVICVPNFSPLGWFSFSSVVISFHQLSTAVDSWWQLSWKKLYWILIYTLKVICVPNFSLLGWFSFSSVVISCWHEKKLNEIFIYTLRMICVQNFSPLGWFSFSSVVISCCQLSAAVDSCWQLITADENENQPRVESFRTHHLYGLNKNSIEIFFVTAFNSCWQLMTADDNCNQTN